MQLTVLLMHLLDLPHISAGFENIVVEFIPERHRSELWSRKLGDGAPEEAPYDAVSQVQDSEQYG